MNKYKKLASNTLLFAISTFSSRFLFFIMAPLFSYWFDTVEMNGVKELLNQFANFAIPLVSLGISNAVIRYGLEKNIRKKQVYTNGILAIFMGFVLFILLFPLLRQIKWFTDYIFLLYVYVLVSCLRTLNCQFCRSRQLNRLYAIDGIFCTIVTCLFYVLFLRVLNMGPTGYLLAVICADGLSSLFLFFVAGMKNFIDFRHVNVNLLKKMLRYSLPLVPASIFWWVTNASDQFFVAAMMEDGEAWTAIYGASYKLPTILTIVSTVFTEAWQLSAFTDSNTAERERFFSQVFKAYQSVMFLAAGGIILMAKPFMMVFREDYFIGWKFIPILTLATVFASFDNFLNSIYMVEKRSTLSLYTMAIGAALNAEFNYILIPIWGVNGAAIATFISYLAVFLMRAFNTRGLIQVDFVPKRLCLNLALILLESVIMLLELPLWPLWCMIIIVIIFVLNFRSLWDTVTKVLGKRKRA